MKIDIFSHIFPPKYREVLYGRLPSSLINRDRSLKGSKAMPALWDMDFRLVNLIDRAREVGLPIIYIQAIYASENNWYLSDVYLEQAKRRGETRNIEIDYPVCEKGSWGADYYTGIKPLPEEAVVQKHRWSAFVDTELDTILRSKGIRTLIMSGVATNVCVESTARDGFMKDYYIVFLKDCTAAYSEELHNNTLVNIDLFFGEVVNSSNVTRCWAKSR